MGLSHAAVDDNGAEDACFSINPPKPKKHVDRAGNDSGAGDCAEGVATGAYYASDSLGVFAESTALLLYSAGDVNALRLVKGNAAVPPGECESASAVAVRSGRLATNATETRHRLDDMADESHNPVASDQLRRELHDVIRRYGQESDVTVYQAIGVLEIVKLDLVEMLEKARE